MIPPVECSDRASSLSQGIMRASLSMGKARRLDLVFLSRNCETLRTINGQSVAISDFLLMPFNRFIKGSRQDPPLVVMYSKCAVIPVSWHVRRSSGWNFCPLHKQGLASRARQYFPEADTRASLSSTRAPERLLATKSVLSAIFLLTADFSNSDGITFLPVISHLRGFPRARPSQ